MALVDIMLRNPTRTDEPLAAEQNKTKERMTVRMKVLEAWKFTVASGVLAGLVICLINIITLAVIYTQHQSTGSSIAFFTGSCRTTEIIAFSSHLVINILSTILLAYSNFSMQCLSSPTRKEVDLAHQKHRSLSIGTPSIRNIFFVSKIKAALWLLLGVSSFPLHMIWNSAVFRTRNSYDYLAISVTEDFFHGGNWTLPPHEELGNYFSTPMKGMEGWTFENLNNVIRGLQSDELEKLGPEECIKEYYTDILSDRRHVLLVRDKYPSDPWYQGHYGANSSVAMIYHASNPLGGGDSLTKGPLYGWMCNFDELEYADESCPLSSIDSRSWYTNTMMSYTPEISDSNQNGWSYYGPVHYCYSQTIPERCKVSVIPTFLVIVIVCNVIKTAAFASALYITKANKDQPLCTTGDAIQSFLKRPDPFTQGRCLAAKKDYDKWLPKSKEWIPRPTIIGDLWTGGRYRWHKASSKWQWVLYAQIVGLVIWALIYYLSWGSSPISTEMSEIEKGNRLNKRTMDVLRGYIIGNIPQLVISYIYLVLNNILSNMLAMAEWCQYAMNGEPKGLRVSLPAENTAQRSKYFLSVPFKWAIPWTVALTIFHWAVSQALVFANLDIYRMMPNDDSEIYTLGYLYTSSVAGIISASIGGTIVLTIILISLGRRYPANIPLSGCCSASIAAACHPARVTSENDTSQCGFDSDLPYQKLEWGVTQKASEPDDIGHATFAAEGTTSLMKGELYA